MGQIQPMAKFKVEDRVMVLERSMDISSGAVLNTVAVETCVTERKYSSEMGWLYKLLGYQGYLEESIIGPYDETKIRRTEHAAEGGVYETVNPTEIQAEYARAGTAKVGDYILGVDVETDEEVYGLIVGMVWEEDEFTFDVAELSPQGNFVLSTLVMYLDEFQVISSEEMAAIIQERKEPERRKPILTLVHSR